MFKHLRFDSFVADIGLYLSCFSTGIKSAHTFYKTYVAKIQCAPVRKHPPMRCSETINPFINLRPATSQSGICNYEGQHIVLKNETHASPLNLFLGLLIF